MADINVQRKSSKIWPILIGLLVLGLLAWAALSFLDGSESVETVEVEETTTGLLELEPESLLFV